MRRRSFLRIATASTVGLAGCTAVGLPGIDGTDDATPSGDCPDRLAADVTVCPHREGGPLSVRRAGAAVSSDHWSLRVTVTNRAAAPFWFDPDGWSLFRHTGNDWSRAVPAPDVGPRVELVPGDRYVWGLATADSATVDADRHITVDLGPGRYGLAVPFRGSEWVETFAPFAVDG